MDDAVSVRVGQCIGDLPPYLRHRGSIRRRESELSGRPRVFHREVGLPSTSPARSGCRCSVSAERPACAARLTRPAD